MSLAMSVALRRRLLIALALLLPDFDGRTDSDWGGDQEEWKPF